MAVWFAKIKTSGVAEIELLAEIGSIETVSKLLGDTKIASTQIYAKVVERKVSDDMAILKQKFANKTNIDASKRIAN